MSRRGENIFKRKDGRWEARYIHHYENGVAKYRYLYANSYAEVKQKRLDEISMPQNCISVRSKALATVEQLAADWLIDTRTTVKESTYTRYCMTVEKHIVPTLGKYALKRVDFHTVNRFSADLMVSGGANATPLSPKSVADILCVLKSIFKFGRLNGYPCATLDSIRYPQKAAKPIHIKIFILNNKVLGKISETQHFNHNNRFAATAVSGGYTVPKFEKIAEAYGIRAVTLDSYDELDNYKEWIDDELPCLFDISLPEESYLTPKIKFETGMINPKLDDDVFRKVKAILKR